MNQSTCGAVFCQPSGDELKHDINDEEDVKGIQETVRKGNYFIKFTSKSESHKFNIKVKKLCSHKL